MDISTSDYTITLTSSIASGYKYIHAVQLVTVSDTTFIDSAFTEEESSYDLDLDGYYILSEIKLPEEETTDGYYILDDTIYDPDGETMTVEELLAVDTDDTNIDREDNDYILVYYLTLYYHNLIKKKFLKNICNCSCINKQDKVTIDTLTMGLEILKSLEEYEQYSECETIIEQLSTCTGLDNANCNCYE